MLTTNKTPEQVRLEKQVMEYVTLVIDPENNIDLLGHQPRLHNIRKAWQDKQINIQELGIVLTALAKDLDGEAETFKSIKEFKHLYWSDLPKKRQEKRHLTTAEQTSLISNILKDKTKTAKRAPSKPKKIEVDLDALPAHLRKFATR